MQIVIISNRPDVARGTLGYVAALMPFISEAVIVCPACQVGSFQGPGQPLPVSVLAEEEVLGDLHPHFVRSTDHQRKNWLLRSALPGLGGVAAEFLMADDDHRPLRRIAPEMFSESGRHRPFHTYDLARWTARETAFDAGQHRTRRLLAERGYPTLSYSAHMPQIIDKALLAAVVREFAAATEGGVAIDEWSAYFNVARVRRPERFLPPRLFETLCWPALPTDWDAGVRPTRFSFENFHPPLYASGGLFADIPQEFEPTAWQARAEAKIARRQALQRVYDSAAARLLRRAAWLLHKVARRGAARLDRMPALRGALRRLAPRGLRSWLRALARHGDDPAWSFPSFLARRRVGRRGSHGGPL